MYVWWGEVRAYLAGLFQASQGQSSILGDGRAVSIVGDPWRMSEGGKDEGLSALGGLWSILGGKGSVLVLP